MDRRTLVMLGGLLAIVAAEAAGQAPASRQRVEEVRIVRGGAGGDAGVQMAGDVLIAVPDVPWMALGGTPEAVLEESVKGAPFTADAVTESTQTLSDGNRIVRNATTSLARDGEGRTRREQAVRARFSDGGTPAEPGRIVTIADPVAGERYLLDPDRRTARKLPRMFVRPDYPGAPPPRHSRRRRSARWPPLRLRHPRPPLPTDGRCGSLVRSR